MDNTIGSPAAVSNTLTTGSAQYTAMAAVQLRTVPGIYIIGSSAASNSGQCNATAGGSVAGAGVDLVGKVNVVTVAFASNGSSVTTVTETIPGSNYTKQAFINGGTTTRIEIWAAPVSTAASGSVLVNISPSNAKVSCALTTYVGVAGFGSTTTATGTTANPSTAALTTQDPNNVVVGGFAWTGTVLTTCPIPSTFRASATTTGTVLGVCDNTRTTTGSLTTQATHVSGQWAAAALEVRATRSGWNYTTGAAHMT